MYVTVEDNESRVDYRGPTAKTKKDVSYFYVYRERDVANEMEAQDACWCTSLRRVVPLYNSGSPQSFREITFVPAQRKIFPGMYLLL